GHDPEGEDREVLERAAGEHVEEGEQPLLLGDRGPHHVAVDPGHGDEHADAVDGEHPEGEDHTSPELRDLVKVADSREGRHGACRWGGGVAAGYASEEAPGALPFAAGGAMTTTLPPALSILAAAPRENRWAWTTSFLVSSPWPRILRTS